MKVFVTGATGVIGRPVVRGLVAAGHEVRAAVRNDGRAAAARALGADPVVVDLFDPTAAGAAVGGAGAVVHLATRIPPISRGRRRRAWSENDRLRIETTRHLVDGALAGGVATVVAESITFAYPGRGDEWIDESVPFEPEPDLLRAVGILEDEVARFAATGGRGVSLRFGAFYGPDARGVDEYLDLARRRVGPTLGKPGSYVSSIHTDDAAAAVLAAVATPSLESGAYNVVDDEPVTRRTYVDAFAGAFGLARLRLLPAGLVRAVGGAGVGALMRSQRVSNRRFRDATGWVPAHPDVREGWPAVAAARVTSAEPPLIESTTEDGDAGS